jgi:hypothetical protein
LSRRGPATRDYHPSKRCSTAKKPAPGRAAGSFAIPRDSEDVVVEAEGRPVKLTNVNKFFWPEEGYTKGDLLQYYADVSRWLIPHLRDRAMVMKRYPHGAAREFFFMKRAPSPRPDWIELCSIEHGSGNVIDFPIVQDLPSLLWVVNLGCIDLNEWYARCDDVDRPDYLHFDLDPVPGADFGKVLQTALLVREALDSLRMPNYAKNDGLERDPRVRPDRPRPDAETGVDVREGVRSADGGAQAGPGDRRVQGREAAEGTRSRRLQPERVGADSRFDLLRASKAPRDRLHSRDVEGARTWRRDRGLPH